MAETIEEKSPEERLQKIQAEDQYLQDEENRDALAGIYVPPFENFGLDFAKLMADTIDKEVSNAFELFQTGHQRISEALDKFEIDIERRDEIVQLYINKSIKELKSQYAKHTSDTTKNAFDNIISIFAARAASYSADKVLQSIYSLDMSNSLNHDEYMTVLKKAKTIYENTHRELVFNETNVDNKFANEANKLFTNNILNLIKHFINNENSRLQLGILTERFSQRSRQENSTKSISKNWNINFSRLIDSLLENKKEEA